ncbi:hypothetical protein ERO13_D02G130933v2 [Gossypium hirsutum]|uniref:Squamosa promoter-binding-like protein 2 isoform X2 n=2 Tax=Gossypium TaxID=3633 RepID=A0ABM2ZPF0_GOSHI|nr:squamosa promoter-binding-like protein 2 isoform X2 [Gossypium hirsutum]KAG4158633.1 hypothetical protein ERO13_D02G130933v2 [Gossypium hirsutum]KAG4158634.1 hypothetical protein ERO13_D02G130933v2 [Gossypium hirsutum]TYG79733.1 hypothetical protein ES288_D02G160800v1 [Gossypium darwinii]
MESWSYGSEGKGLSFADEMDLAVDASGSRKALLGRDIKPFTDSEAVESLEFMDFGFSHMNKKPFYGNTSLGFGAEFANESAKKLVSPTCMFTSSSYYGEEESGSKQSSSLMEFNSQGSSLIDLKLGRLTDYRDAQHCRHFKETFVVSSVCSAMTAKKARTTSSPCCQVHGCNNDIRSSKDYHKRHKVAVNGIEQRFCQQCSRRSCRTLLAGIMSSNEAYIRCSSWKTE